MGFTRKVMSVSTLGLVDFRSDKERTAAYTAATRNEARKQTAIMRKAAKEAKRPAAAQPPVQATPTTAPPGWYDDGQGMRWWDGRGWTEHRA